VTKGKWDEVEAAREKADIDDAQFDGKNIYYNTNETPELFAQKLNTLLGATNDSGRIQATIRGGSAKIRRNARTHAPEKGIIGYAQSTVLNGQESSPLATDIALRILRHTGGRLTAPTARSFFTARDLTKQQVWHPATRTAKKNEADNYSSPNTEYLFH